MANGCPLNTEWLENEISRLQSEKLAVERLLLEAIEERDRYREALTDLKTHYETLYGKDFLPFSAAYRIMTKALRGGEG